MWGVTSSYPLVSGVMGGMYAGAVHVSVSIRPVVDVFESGVMTSGCVAGDVVCPGCCSPLLVREGSRFLPLLVFQCRPTRKNASCPSLSRYHLAALSLSDSILWAGLDTGVVGRSRLMLATPPLTLMFTSMLALLVIVVTLSLHPSLFSVSVLSSSQINLLGMTISRSPELFVV